MARSRRGTSLPAPYLRDVSLRPDAERAVGYPFDLPWLRDDAFGIEFSEPVTIVVGENGTGKSTLIEALAALAGYDEAGGGKGYRPVDHSRARETGGGALAKALRAAWLPKLTTGWFFKAETFFSVARYLDASGSPSADFLSHSHGEGFVRLFTERMSTQGFYLMDEPESALSPKRQVELLRFLARVQEEASAQVILATHSPILMAVPGAQVLEVSRSGFAEVDYRDTRHFRLYREFALDPGGFVREALAEDADGVAAPFSPAP